MLSSCRNVISSFLKLLINESASLSLWLSEFAKAEQTVEKVETPSEEIKEEPKKTRKPRAKKADTEKKSEEKTEEKEAE